GRDACGRRAARIDHLRAGRVQAELSVRQKEREPVCDPAQLMERMDDANLQRHRPETSTFIPEIHMQAFRKTALFVALGLAAAGAMAGEISNTTITADRATNTAGSNGARALQHIGVTFDNGKILNSRIYADGAKNDSYSRNGTAHQDIGVATRGGTMDNVTVYAQNAYNRTAGSGAVAVQEIGKVSNGLMKNVTVYARGAVNNANNDGSYAEQKIGVVN